MVTRTTLLIFIGCVFGAHVFSQIAHGMVLRGSALVPPDERERIFQRQARIAGLLDLLDYAAIGILLVGMARCFGLIRYAPKSPWGLYAIGGGLALMCLAKVARSWSLVGSYRAETAERNAIGAVVRAAVLVTVVEVALAGGVCWWMASNWVLTGGGSSPASTGKASGSDDSNGSDGSGAESRGPSLLITKAEALKILGKDEEYLQLLVQIREVRTELDKGKTMYRNDDVTGVKEAGLRSIEELRNLAKKQNTPPPPKPKQTSSPVAPSAEDATPVAPPKQEAEPLRE